MILFLKAHVAGYTRKDGTVVSSYYHANQFAEKKHAGQFRKDGKTPYIEHPRAVASILRDEASIRRLIGAVLMEQNEEWQLQNRYMPQHSMTEEAVDLLPAELSAPVMAA